ncbi:MAG: FeoB-associated Cys-rich membrane protein [Spirochaetia bacterium]|nr:FeoB-associated Cys-rich membrane protein [Spirochaetia bacterium]
MNLKDALIIFAVGFLFAFAARRILSKKKNGDCGCNCSDCGSPCSAKDDKKKN